MTVEEMKHHSVFQDFERTGCVGTGEHVFDFIGTGTHGRFRKGWARHALAKDKATKPGLPVVNEHYFDWIAVLQSVRNSRGTFRMAELGAGWAPWLVRAALAAKQRNEIDRLELIAVEADQTHFEWLLEHFRFNGIEPEAHSLLKGAVTHEERIVRFPVLSNPDIDYGASIESAATAKEHVEIPGIPLAQIINSFSGPIDLIHMDIQGAEYDVLPPNINLLSNNVKSIMVGTHKSSLAHEKLAQQFIDAGWLSNILFPRNEQVETDYGAVRFGDGFQYWVNPAFAQ